MVSNLSNQFKVSKFYKKKYFLKNFGKIEKKNFLQQNATKYNKIQQTTKKNKIQQNSTKYNKKQQ